MKAGEKLNLWDIFCIATGAMISSGLFVLPAIAFRYSGPSVVAAYFLAGLLMIPSILSKSELLSAMPKSGGTYFFIERSFGPSLGIFGGLSHWFSISLKSAFALVGIGAFLEYFYPSASINDPHFYLQIKFAAAFFCIIFVVINLFSLKFSARLQSLMVIFLLSACALYIFSGFKTIRLADFRPFLPHGIKPFISVAGLVFISYGGLTKVASIAEETKNPSRTIPLGMFLSFFVVQLLYVLCVAVTIGVLSKTELVSTLTPLTHAALKMGGWGFGIVMSLAALIALLLPLMPAFFLLPECPWLWLKTGYCLLNFLLFPRNTTHLMFRFCLRGFLCFF